MVPALTQISIPAAAEHAALGARLFEEVKVVANELLNVVVLDHFDVSKQVCDSVESVKILGFSVKKSVAR